MVSAPCLGSPRIDPSNVIYKGDCSVSVGYRWDLSYRNSLGSKLRVRSWVYSSGRVWSSGFDAGLVEPRVQVKTQLRTFVANAPKLTRHQNVNPDVESYGVGFPQAATEGSRHGVRCHSFR